MNTFSQTLNQLHRQRSLGRVCLLIVSILIISLIFGLIYGWADYTLALPSNARTLINTIFLVIITIGSAIVLYKIARVKKSVSAALADIAMDDERKRTLAATHLARMNAETEMQEFHLTRTLNKASEQLSNLPLKAKMPLRLFKRFSIVLVALLLCLLGLHFAKPLAFRTIAQRILTPSLDIAPFSHLVFTITPVTPSALYQEDTTIEVNISGGDVIDDVFCLIRDKQSGSIEKVATYKQHAGSFARTFESPVSPVEFAFSTGKARSPWHTLDILYQPQISDVQVTVTPPSYTSKSAQTFTLQSSEIKIPEGATVRLDITSNRPLSSGELSVSELNLEQTSPPRQVEGELVESKTLAFTFDVHRSSTISAVIRDIRSTPADSPLEFTLRTVADEAPLLTIDEPQPLILATPGSEIAMVGEATDDNGLSSVSLVRTLVGYRDRSIQLASGLSRKVYDFKDSLMLNTLGVEPGQILEFYLEATDRNPSLLGVGVSDVVRVQIISEEDYAERLRLAFKLKQFTARYKALASALNKSKTALETLNSATDKKAESEAIKTSQTAHREAKELAKRLAADFKAFAMEESLHQAAEQAAGILEQNEADLQRFDTLSVEEKEKTLNQMLERLGVANEKAAQVQQDAETVKKIADVLELAAEYQRLLLAQESIVKRLDEVAKNVFSGNLGMAARLEGLSNVQDKNRQDLMSLADNLVERIQHLPPEAAVLKQDVIKFLVALKELDIPGPMTSASEAAQNGQSLVAYRKAKLAHELMKKLLDEPDNGF